MHMNHDIFMIFFGAMFIFSIGMIIYRAVLNIRQWHKNNKSPKLSVDATIVAKRSHTSHNHHHHHHGNGHNHMHTTSSTTYYVTFQVQSGDRMELKVQSFDYGMLVEGDHGILTFQGTRFLGFERKYTEQ